MSNENLIAMINQLQAENAKLKSQATTTKAKGKAIRVSAKGGVSVYGLGRFPVTLYAGQWTKLLEMAEEIKAYLVEHKDQLAVKGE